MIKHIKLLFVSFIMTIVCIQDLSATHIVGGSLTYRNIGGSDYEITLVFRRDCFTGDPDADFDDPAKLYFYKENGALAQVGPGLAGVLNLNFNPDDTLGNTFVSDCGFEGTQVCVQETQYRDTIKLPFLEGGYILAYQRCCRNPTIQNIIEPLGTGGTWWTKIEEETLNTQNSSPVFSDWPGVYICASDAIEFDHSATDADGDSLVYKLYTPYSGASIDNPIPNQVETKPPYDQVVWNGPTYGLDNVLGSTVPLTINSETGLLEGIPDVTGQFLVGVLVEEYRDGVKIGETRRDFQYNVRVCSDPPTADFIANDGNCDGTIVEFENTSLGAADYEWNFNYPSTDPAFISTEENPTFEYDEPGVYTVRLFATRFSDDCNSEIIKEVAALTSDIDVSYDLNVQACNDDGGYTISLSNTSVEPQPGFEVIGQNWTITQGVFEQVFTSDNVVLDVLPEDIIIELQVMSETGCNKAITDTIDIDDLLAVADFTFELGECPEAGTATLILTDVSDPLNLYDSPEGFSWEVVGEGGTQTGSVSPFEVDVNDNETVTVTLITDFGGGCTATATKEIDLETLVPQAGYNIDAVACPDFGTVDIAFQSTSAVDNPDYEVVSTEWTILSAGLSTNSMLDTVIINLPKDSLVNVELIVTFNNGCVDTIQESYIPGPFVTIEYTRPDPFKICLGDTVPLLVDPNPDFTYEWNTTDGLVFEGAGNEHDPDLVGIANTIYYVTVTDGLCSLEDSITVEVLDDDNLSITGDSITCDGTVSLTASGGILDGDFVWSTDLSFADTIFIGETLETSFAGASQTYYAAFTGINCNDPYAEFTVTLSEIFSVDFNGDPVRVCLGDTVQLLSNYNPLLTYEWTPTTDLIFPDGDGDAYFVGGENATYNVSLADAFCDFDTMVNVEISDIQQLMIEGDSVICTDTVRLSVSGAIGNGNYEWATDPDFMNIISEADTVETIIDGLMQTFYVRFTDPTCGDETFSYDVRRYLFDLVYVNSFVICPGDTVNIPMFNQGEMDVTYTWEANDHIVSDLDEMSPIIGTSVDENDAFVLYFTTTSSFGCEFTDSVEVSFTENPVVNIQSELTECGQFEVCFTIEGDYDGFPTWDFGDPTTEDDISLEAAPCFTYAGPGVFDVVLNNAVAICPFEPDTLTVTVNDDITIVPIDEQIACLGDEVSITATTPDANVSFSWCTLEGDTLTEGPDITVVADSSYQIVVKAVDVNGCENQQTVDITVVEFDIEDNIGEVFCEGQETFIELTVNGETEGYTFDWGINDCIVSGGDTANPIIVAAGAKTFGVTITDDATGCMTTEEYSVDVTSFTVTANADPDTINPGESTFVFVEDQIDEYTYEWDNGSLDGEQEVSPEETTTYTVTVTDDLGCTAVASTTVTVREPVCDESDVFIPNAFTPNQDGVNDILFVRSNFIDQLDLIIYNRWGEEVFKTNDPSAGWDGTYNGDRMAPDVYAYYMEVLCINGVRYNKRGNVSLLK